MMALLPILLKEVIQSQMILFSFCQEKPMTVIETLVVVGKHYDSSEHPATSVPLNEILGSNDCAGLNGAERWSIGGRANSYHRLG